MTDADLILLTQRVAARLPDVRALTLSSDGTDRLVWAGTCTAPPLMGPTTGSAPLYDGTDAMASMLAELIADGTMSRLLPEIVLTGDTAITIGPHALRIAERREVVRQQPRTDGGYSEENGAEDFVKVMEALRDACEEGSGATINDPRVFRTEAVSLLTSLRMFRPLRTTDGGRWIAGQHEASQRFDGKASPDDAEGPNGSPEVPGGSTQTPHPSPIVVGPSVTVPGSTWRYTETRTNGDTTETRESLRRTALDGTLVQVEPPRRGFDFTVSPDDPDTRDAAQVAALGACPGHPILVGTTYAATEAGIVTLPDALPEDDAAAWAEIVAGEEPTELAAWEAKHGASVDTSGMDVLPEVDEAVATMTEALLHPWQHEARKP